MPYRTPFDPAQVARDTQAEYDARHRFDEAWEHRARFVSRPLLTCSLCGKPVAAKAVCGACGDETDEAAA